MQHVVPIKRSPKAAEFKEEKQRSPSKHQTLGLPLVDDNFKRRRRCWWWCGCCWCEASPVNGRCTRVLLFVYDLPAAGLYCSSHAAQFLSRTTCEALLLLLPLPGWYRTRSGELAQVEQRLPGVRATCSCIRVGSWWGHAETVRWTDARNRATARYRRI